MEPPVAAGGPGIAPASDEFAFREPSFELLPVEGERRSVVLLVLDTVRAQSLALYGGRVPMPNLERFAREAVVVDEALSHATETCLSHWTLLTGVLPEIHGSVPKQRTTQYRGPNLADIATRSEVPTGGFTAAPSLMRGVCGLSGFSDWREDFAWETFEGEERPGDEVARVAAGWAEAQTEPYFLFVNLFDAHTPYTPGAPWDTAFDPDYEGALDGSMESLAPWMEELGVRAPESARRHGEALYEGEIAELDEMVGVLLDAVGDDAVVVITADHGESFEHGYLFNHRAVVWQSVLHVPLLIRAPGLTPRRASDGFFSLVDLAPTLAELAGLPVDASMMGASRAAWLRGDEGAAVPTVHHARVNPWHGEGAVAVRLDDTKLAFDELSPTRTELFDLVDDPGELRPLDGPTAAHEQAYAAYRRAIDEAAGLRDPPRHGLPPEHVREQLQAIGYTE